MGFFDVFKTIGSGISSAVSTVGHGISKVATGAYNSVLKPVYNKVLKPVYNSVIKPIGKPIGKVFSKGEALVDKGLDFSGRFIDKTGGTLDNLAGGAFNLSKLLENPFVMLGAGILGLVVASKM